ncbi:MAG TPA: MarR family transcriptional regulator [Vicinamibacterales bacterium]|nr:MarR family transcriptional regulator [Vicinamibacterales bacterium]
MNVAEQDGCRAWQLLVKFFFAQREHLPSCGATWNLSPVQCHVLHLIEPGRPVPMGRLAATLSCDASNVTGLVDRLESRGLVQRRPSADDRRVKVIHLTTAGSRVRSQLLRRMTGGTRPLSKLSRDQQRTLVEILRVLVNDKPRNDEKP